MASINLGRVGFVLRGTWSSGATYNPLDVVLYNGTSYAAKTTSTGLAPSAASAAWQELTQVSSAVSSGIAESAVRYDTSQNLNGSQKTTARDNIDAASNASVSAVQGTVSDLSSRVNIAEGHVDSLSSEVSDLTDQVDDGFESLRESIAPIFDESTVYSSGQYVYYEDSLYKLTADHATGTAWGSTSKIPAVIGNDLASKITINETTLVIA